jgi:hypothetical protein
MTGADLRPACRILREGGLTKRETERLIGLTDRAITKALLEWARAVRAAIHHQKGA